MDIDISEQARLESRELLDQLLKPWSATGLTKVQLQQKKDRIVGKRVWYAVLDELRIQKQALLAKINKELLKAAVRSQR